MELLDLLMSSLILIGHTVAYPYIGVALSYSWSDASTYCATTYGTELATITKSSQTEEVRYMCSDAHVTTGRCWIGLNDIDTEGVWVWDDGTSASYTRWYPGEPNNSGSGEDCASVLASGTWNDEPCTKQMYFVCNEREYIGVSLSKSWSDAKEYCATTYGTTLATITSAYQNDLVQTKCKSLGGSQKCWISANDLSSEGTWLWQNDCLLHDTYSNWSPGEPNDVNGGEHCAEIYAIYGDDNGLWNDDTCTDQKYFVCNGRAATSCGSYNDYIGVDISMTRDEAGHFCESAFDTSLATITSFADNIAVQTICDDITGGDPCWIGANDVSSEGTWTWQNDCPLSATYNNWYPGEPNNYGSNEDCAEMYGDVGLWNDDRCTNENYFVCNGGQQPGCYIGVDQSLSWSDASDYCTNNYGTQLATVVSEGDNGLLASKCADLTNNGNCWIGANDISAEATWEWDSQCSFEYTNWGSGEPSNGGDCSKMMTGLTKQYGEWNDYACSYTLYFVCDLVEPDCSTSSNIHPYQPQLPLNEPPSSRYLNELSSNWAIGIVVVLILMAINILMFWVHCCKKYNKKKQKYIFVKSIDSEDLEEEQLNVIAE